MVDVAYNDGKYVEVTKWQTQGGRPQKIVTANCDSNMSNTLATQAYGTSGHKHNLKPGCDESLSKIHSIIVCTKRSDTRMKVSDDV